MKTSSLKRFAVASLTFATLLSVARADTLLNSFDVPFDYVANGIIGDTNWDGVYLRGGEIPGGSLGGSGSGNQLLANTTVFGGGFLGLQNANGDWSGADNDGFFIYKVVDGDFDVSVESVPGTLGGGTGYDARGFNFAGLQIRAYHTNNSGAAYSTTVTNANAENSYRLWRFHEFNIDGQIRRSTNGANGEFTYAPDTSAGTTNETRFYRIVRENGTNFYFYWKALAGDPWLQITNGATPNGVATRADWVGVKLQVGIAQAAFSTAARDALFDNFSLTGPGVTFPARPAAPSSLVTVATNIGGSLTFSWTPAGDGSLLVISPRPIQHNPVSGIVYNSDSAYGSAAARLGAANAYVVYNGAGNSVTVTNLGANNLTYYAALYSYSNPLNPVYNTATPVTTPFPGPGVITSAAVAAITNNIPISGAVKLRLIASFSTGETSDQSGATTWSSSDTAVATVDAAGTVSGLASGVTTITATFGPYTPSTNITVHPPVFTDNFASTNDFLAGGLLGSRYDGLFLRFGDVPGGAPGADGNGNTVVMDSQITSTNGLYMSSVQSTWSSAGNDGPFLYKVVPGNANSVAGDFTAVLHITNMNTLNGVFAGIMARTYAASNHSAGPGGTEWHVNYWKQQNGATSIRLTQAGAGGGTVLATGPNAANAWLCLQRVNTNFYFYEKAVITDPWTFVTNLALSVASNAAPMEVGIAQQSTAGVNAVATFDSFMLDAPGIVTAIPTPPAASGVVMTLNLNLSMTINYTVATNPAAANNFYRSVVIMRDGGPVSAQPWTGMGLGGNSVFGDPNNSIGGGNYVVYRSPAPTTTANQSVTVTGLIPGHTYYAAVFTFDGAGATRTFNQDASQANSSLQDGVLQSLEVLPTPAIPRGGIGFMQVIGHYTGGANLNVSPFATITSDNTNVIKVLAGVLTGITNGTANIRLVYSGVTNDAAVTVRDPGFTDGFDVNRDYFLNGAAGSGWHGVYNPSAAVNGVPLSPYVPLAGSGAIVADANVSSNGLLTVTAAGDGWEAAAAGGFFLYRYVPGDFQMAVRLDSYQVAAFNQPGLLARAYGVDTNTFTVGAPFGTLWPNANGTNDLGEYWVSLCRFDEFGIGTYARRNIDSGVSQNTQPDPLAAAAATNQWLLIVRTGGSEFDFYKRASLTDAWQQVPNKTHFSLTQFAGQPMQVGIMAGPWNGTGGSTGNYLSAWFDNFMLDATSGSPLRITTAGTTAVLSWPPIAGAQLQSTDGLQPIAWQNVPGTPTLTATGYSLSLPINLTTNRFFRLVQ